MNLLLLGSLIASGIVAYITCYSLLVYLLGGHNRSYLWFAIFFFSVATIIICQGFALIIQTPAGLSFIEQADISLITTLVTLAKISHIGMALLFVSLPLAVRGLLDQSPSSVVIISGIIIATLLITFTTVSDLIVDSNVRLISLVDGPQILSPYPGPFLKIFQILLIALIVYEMVIATYNAITLPQKRHIILPILFGLPLFISGAVVEMVYMYAPGDQPQKVLGFTFGIFLMTLFAVISTIIYNIHIYNKLNVSEKHVKRLLFKSKKDLLDFTQLIATTLDARDQYTMGHSQRVMHYSNIIARQMNITQEDRELLKTACLLHDIGKIGIPDKILNKPGRLTTEEFEIIKEHPTIATEILSNVSEFVHVIPYIAHHHERIDGKGYPHGLHGKDIPLLTKIMSIADTYDAITSNRPYRAALSIERAIQILEEVRGTQLDGDIVGEFIKCLLEEEKSA